MSKLLGKLLTRSFPGKPSEAFPVLNPSAEPVDGTAAGNQAEARGYESRAFALWLDELVKLNGSHLIDFGPMRPQSVTFFGDYHMGLSILGLDAAEDLNDQLAAFEPDGQYDAALCWEIPNYVDPLGLEVMGRWLAQHIKPGGVVMLSLAVNSPYADLPSSYGIVDTNHLECIQTKSDANRQQRYSTRELTKYWPSFTPIRSFLLRSGRQEYVLRRRMD